MGNVCSTPHVIRVSGLTSGIMSYFNAGLILDTTWVTFKIYEYEIDNHQVVHINYTISSAADSGM